ncbi:hypothetical protein V9L05_18245 [Bernardetia sp. Wsw4-3y2]|uniref:hypothetical protein n=1 Tax=Bernardetia sp. Wsw4-3y2 TaxID=3127471 RepID=UPI0030D01DCF
MVTIQDIDFDKLLPYEGKTANCFEQLCYQIAAQEYGHLGSLSAIDGSGGDGGVEFYLELENGEVWGWQCKYFGDNGRLNTSSRKKQISDSLETACRNYPNLTKWILCLKTDLTHKNVSKKGDIRDGEMDWFKDELPKSIPQEQKVKLEPWGKAELLLFLQKPQNTGIRNFFFGNLNLNQDWFKKKFYENFEKVKDKYDTDLHTIDKYTKSIIDLSLFNISYLEVLSDFQKELIRRQDEIENSIYLFMNEVMISDKENQLRSNYGYTCLNFNKYILIALEKIEIIKNSIINYKEKELDQLSLEVLIKNMVDYLKTVDYSVFKDKYIYQETINIHSLLSDFIRSYERFFYNYFSGNKKNHFIHFIADAGKGKTHLSCDIAYSKINNNEPAVFITGDKFSNKNLISEAIRDILDINTQFTFEDFLSAINVYGGIIKKKVPIIIDGLNETRNNSHFSDIWEKDLNSFIVKIKSYNNLFLITTCRTSYKERIWEASQENFIRINGFSNDVTIKKAVENYFLKYKIKSDISNSTLEKFSDPIFLKIFCEIKNPKRQVDKWLDVNIEEESRFDIFDKYLKQVNSRVIQSHTFFRRNEDFIVKSLLKIATYLWENDMRGVPIDDFYDIVDNGQPYDKNTSRAEVLINEGLLVNQDNRIKEESIGFTYDTMAGYLIAKKLVNEQKLDYFITPDFVNKIELEAQRHAFFDDIVPSLAILLRKEQNSSFHELIGKRKNIKFKYCFSQSIISLFKLPADKIKDIDKTTVEDLFNKDDNNKKVFFALFLQTVDSIDHPLNINFLSDLLYKMTISTRDLTWTEYVRKEIFYIDEIIQKFEEECKSVNNQITEQKQHLRSYLVMWCLSSTNRPLRDKATRALYYYGRKYPQKFSDLVLYSLKINDPYIWERTLASLYGVAMAEHTSLYMNHKDYLPSIGKSIYDHVFSETASYSMTHILARDYARQIIEVCLIYYPNLLKECEIKNIRPPYTFGGIRELGEVEYDKIGFHSSSPIQMDFNNYTLGSIVKGGHSYSDPPEKQKVRRQAYWRIYNLGWTEKEFGEVDGEIEDEGYYEESSETKTERYGKKYSWIAYFENAGLRDDLNLLEKDEQDARFPYADIDPSFPETSKSENFIKDDFLEDREMPLKEWYAQTTIPVNIEKSLQFKDVNNNEWVCLDGHISQRDNSSEREIFSFTRSFLVKNKDYNEFVDKLSKQYLGGRWLPEVIENYYTYAGEMYLFGNVVSNSTTLSFTIKTSEKIIKRGEEGYYPKPSFNLEGDTLQIHNEYPEEMRIEFDETVDFEVLMPVMQYNWENHHSILNKAGHTNLVSKELAEHLELVGQAQSFDLLDKAGVLASKNIHYSDKKDTHNFTYIRKDLIDKFTKKHKMKLVQVIWGERNVRFQTDEAREEFFEENSFERNYQVFQKVITG